jgi:hypothetical protein
MPNLGKGRIHHLLVVVTVAGALTAGLYAQRGGQTAAPQSSGPRPSTAPSLAPVRLGVDGNFRIAPPYAPTRRLAKNPTSRKAA